MTGPDVRPGVPESVEAPPASAPTELEESTVPTIFKVLTVLVFTFLLAPIIVVLLASVNAGQYLTFPPQGFSLQWIRNFFELETLRSAFLFSMRTSFFAAVVATTVGTMTAIWLLRAIRRKARSAPIVMAVLLTPIVLPGIAVGFAVFVALRNLGIGNSSIGLTMVQALAVMPFVVVVVVATLYGIDPNLELAARSLGFGPGQVFRRVTFPLAAPGVTAGFLFAFIVSFGQTGLSLFLTPANESTLPLAIYFYLRFQFDPTPAAAGTFSILMVVVSVMLLNWLTPLGRLAGTRTK